MTNDLLDRLERIADEPVVPLPANRVAHIETSLRALYPLPVSNRPKHVRMRVAVAAAVAAVLALVILNVGDPPGSRTDLLLTSASKTVVVMPDGTRVTGRAGLALPDGARVIVARGGHASIGDVAIAGGSTATVDDGAVDVRRSPAGARDTTNEFETNEAGSGGASANSPPGQTPTTGGATPSPTTVRAGTPPPPVTRPPTATTTPATQPPTTASPTTLAPRGSTAPRARLRAIATRRGREIVVRWQAFEGPGPVRYVVVATTAQGAPSYPTAGGSTVVARTGTETTARFPARAGMRVRVVALSDDNRVVAYSAVLTPTAAS
jgi:hypothetical protein